MKRNPAKPKISRPKHNVGVILEALRTETFKNSLANYDYAHALRMDWAAWNTGKTKKAT